MGKTNVIGLNPDQILGATKATHFLFAELVVTLGYGKHFSERTKDLERILMERGLTDIKDGGPSMTSEDYPYYIEGIRSSLRHISDLIDDKLSEPKELPETPPQLMSKSSVVGAEVDKPVGAEVEKP